MLRRLGVLLTAFIVSPAMAQTTAVEEYALIGEAIEAGRFIQARAMLANRKMVEGNAVSVAFEIAHAELALGEHRDAQALAAFGDLDRRGISDCRVQAGYGTTLLRQQRPAEALPHLKSATQTCPGNWRNWNGLGVALDLAGDWQESAKAFETAFQATNDQAAIMNNFGFSLLLQRRFTEAVRMFEQASRVDPANVRYANNADIARTMGGQPLTPSNSEDPDVKARRLNNAGYASLLAGRRQEAAAYFSRSLHASDSFYQRASANLSAVAGE